MVGVDDILSLMILKAKISRFHLLTQRPRLQGHDAPEPRLLAVG